nr:sigma-54-dependent Fis family transcriptional regulator [Oceanobacter mangrovi]
MGNEVCIVLANADAKVLSCRGQAQYQDQLSQWLQPGVSWQESLFGTNALGTVLQDRQPIHIRQGEHYLESLAGFSCSGAPIHDSQGELVGILDITRHGRLGTQQDTNSLVTFAVRNIESRIFFRQCLQQLVIAFHAGQHYLRSSWQGLLALDDSGHVCAVNSVGCQLLKREREGLLGLNIRQLLDVGLGDLLAAMQDSRSQGIAQRRTPLGKLYFRLAHNGSQSALVSLKSTSPSVRPNGSMNPEVASDDWAPALQRSFGMSLKALDRCIPVLLRGETGTGKEVAARSLHRASQRHGQPFVAVNCAAIPENLIESELFGYREGAFTGSRKGGMKGRLEQANGGTLFLDEIGDMPLDLQARLLRVLQERRIQPLGAAEDIPLDVQVIGATHRNLKQMVAEGLFREDLFYRLNGVTITLPPLRERSDFGSLLQRLMQAEGRSDVSIEPGLLARLKSYHWPGNVRQLQMVLQVALAFMENHENQLTDEHLTPDFLEELEQPAQKSGLLQDNESVLIRQALDKHNGNVSAAANALGISRATLYRKIREMPGASR